MTPQRTLAAGRAKEEGGRSAEPELSFDIARSLCDVTEAWKLLYEAYLRAGFIQENPYGLHTVPEAIGSHVLVVVGRSDDRVVSTISAIGDNPRGLPLDSVYPDELSRLRAEGRRLVEIGLFGDRRDLMGETSRTFHAILELMRYTYHFGYYLDATDCLCGIPPRRSRLYYRMFGFQPIGEVKSYATVEGNPVVLLHLTAEYAREHYAKHRALVHFAEHPIPDEIFKDRFRFSESDLAGSQLEGYLKAKSAGGPARAEMDSSCMP